MNTDILQMVAEREDSLPALIQSIRGDQLPLLMLGVGTLGEYYYELLTRRGIRIADVVVHSEYWTPQKTFRGLPVLPIDCALKKYSEMNIICAIQYTKLAEQAKENLLSTGKVRHVFTYDTGCTHWGFHSFSYNDLLLNRSAYSWLYDELADPLSRDTLIAYLNQRISGKTGYLEKVYDAHHLFPPDIIQMDEGEILVDCGAFDGASILDFENAMHSAGLSISAPIYAWEPDALNRERLLENCQKFPTLKIIPFGAWDKQTTLKFSNDSGATSRIGGTGSTQIQVDSLDHVLHEDKVTYIKMDIEGAEMEALKGAAQTIQRWRPKLGISVYHKTSDLVQIPAFIRSLIPDYKLYLRAHSYGANNVLLYAI